MVGPCKEVFKVSLDLLTHCSPVFEKLCSLPLEYTERVIELAEDDPSTFELFFIWLHSPTPYMPLDSDSKSLINLGVFAEKYRIRRLMNQISDFIRTTVIEDR